MASTCVLEWSHNVNPNTLYELWWLGQSYFWGLFMRQMIPDQGPLVADERRILFTDGVTEVCNGTIGPEEIHPGL